MSDLVVTIKASIPSLRPRYKWCVACRQKEERLGGEGGEERGMETTTTTSRKERSSTEGETAEGGMQQQQEQAMVDEVEKKQMKVMVAIDESEESFHALNWALDHLFFFFLPSSSSSYSAGVAAAEAEPTPNNQEQGKVILLHVQQPFQHYLLLAGPAVYATSSMLDSVKEAQEQNSGALLAQAFNLCKERQVQAEAMVIDGEPKEMICQATEQIQPTLLVIGSRGLGKIKRAFLGSVSDYCAHHAKCPVLIVKPPK